MISLEVVCTCKDDKGNITCLGTASGQVDKSDAIDQIEARTHHYWVAGEAGGKVDVRVVPEHKPPYLRTDPDGTPVNNLDELPDC